MTPLRASVLTTACALVLGAMTGCQSATVTPDPLEASVGVAVYQGRIDISERRLQVSVTNMSDEPLTVSSVTVESPLFVEDAVWPKDGTTVPAGQTRDLPVLLGDPTCDSDDATAIVVLEVSASSESAPHSIRVTPDDPFAHLARVRSEDCAARDLAAVADITLPLPVASEIGGRPVAVLDVPVIPTGSGNVTLNEVRSTVLLSLVHPESGELVRALPLDLTITADSPPSTVRLALAPARCDPHAVAEDKRGTVLPFAVTGTDGSTAVALIASSDEVKAALYEFVATTCGFPTAR